MLVHEPRDRPGQPGRRVEVGGWAGVNTLPPAGRQLADRRDDAGRGCTGVEDAGDSHFPQLLAVFLGDDSADHERQIAEAAVAAEALDLGHDGHVGGGEQADAEDVDVLLEGGADGGKRGLPEAGVDDLHAGVAEVADDELGPAVVAVEADFRDQDADRAVHGSSTIGARRRRAW
jgi:hypothetical protein